MPMHHVRSLNWCLACCRDRALLHSFTTPTNAALARSTHYARQTTRNLSSKVSPAPQDIGIVGGGITGLSAAYYTAKTVPTAKITLYEQQKRLGGWMKSTKVDVGDGHVIFESGPRTVRPNAPNGALTLNMIEDLDLTQDLIVTPKSAPSARNRFIYYPDHLVKMPGPGSGILETLSSFWNEPALYDSVKGIAKNFVSNFSNAPVLLPDESVGSYVSRRFSKATADNIVSALFHGIYAGDIWKLSAKSILPLQWEAERKWGDWMDGAFASIFKKTSWQFCDDIALQVRLGQQGWGQAMREKIADCSVFAFQDGLDTLARSLEQWLEQHPNVTIRREFEVRSVNDSEQEDTVSVSGINRAKDSGEEAVETHTHKVLIHTLSLKHLVESTFKQKDWSADYLKQSQYAPTVAVTNLYYKTPNLLRTLNPPGGLPRSLQSTGLAGFGYLMPQSLPFEQNPERALGVIFDDDAAPGVLSTVPAEQRGTRLTVMFGGHWWDGWDGVPEQGDYKDMAMSLLQRHLGITEEPLVEHTTIQHKCIPQYTVGHSERMSRLHSDLHDIYKGRVKVAGSWYKGVGVNDCIRAGHDIANAFSSTDWRDKTGLDSFYHGRPLCLIQRSEGVITVLEVEEKGKAFGYFPGVAVEKRREKR